MVHEQFFTDTTDYADIVLPATTFFEHKDLQAAYGHYYLQVSDQAIEPLGECRANVEVFRALAERMGFKDACFGESIDEMIDGALASKNPWLEGISRERLEREGQVRLNFSGFAAQSASGFRRQLTLPFLPFAHGNFRTPSGKAELYSEAMKALGLDPVAEFTPPAESRHGKQGAALPLELLARKADNFLNSTFSNLPSVQEMEETNFWRSFRRCPGARNCRRRDGEGVQPPGRNFLESPSGWRSTAGSGLGEAQLGEAGSRIPNINVLTSEKLSDLGNSATFYSVLVEVELAKPFP